MINYELTPITFAKWRCCYKPADIAPWTSLRASHCRYKELDRKRWCSVRVS